MTEAGEPSSSLAAARTPRALAESLRDQALLDVRDEGSFAAGHLPGSGHIPVALLKERRAELPPRDAALTVIAEDGPRARAAADLVLALGYPRVAWLDGAPADVPGVALEQGNAARLWRASPFLDFALRFFPEPRSGRRRVLDLAAGAGREAVTLALLGYEVEAWDHDRQVLERAQAMARRHGTSIDIQVRDLERRDPGLPHEAFDVVAVFRFLHRPLLPRIAATIGVGGLVVYETYLKGQERFGRPKHPRFLLDPGELPRRFPGFAVEHYEERTPPEGPFLARMVARRLPSSEASPPP